MKEFHKQRNKVEIFKVVKERQAVKKGKNNFTKSTNDNGH